MTIIKLLVYINNKQVKGWPMKQQTNENKEVREGIMEKEKIIEVVVKT